MIDDQQDDEDEDSPTATLIEMTALELSDKADWRRQKARQYPDDERNLDAAELLDRLAGEVLALEDSPAALAFETACDIVFSDEDRARKLMLLWSDYRSGIGFRLFPDTGETVLQDLMKMARLVP